MLSISPQFGVDRESSHAPLNGARLVAHRWMTAMLVLSSAVQAGASATHGMVASVNTLATQAGVAVLKQGGNAVDAAIAVALTLGVVDGQNSGIGGGCFILIRRSNGALVAIDGRESAPAAATRDMFVRDGKADTRLSQTGALASGVPGALAAYEFAAKRFGHKRFDELILPAADVAENGFVLDREYASNLKSVADDLARFAGSRAVFYPNGKLLGEGDTLRQPELATTYRQIAARGSVWFYRGPFSKALETWMRSNSGVMTAQDLGAYRIRLREPVISSYRGYQIVGFPPPSSGGVHVAEALNILEHFDVKNLSEPARVHLLAETMKLVFADRAYWLGDPEFARVPRGLLDKGYAAELSRKLDLNRTTPKILHGLPPNWQADTFKKHTTHISVADAEGNWVACTTTVNTAFGSKVIIPGTGVVMNNQMDDFSIQPGATNAFGLVGAEANAVAPGKRPLSSMSPTFVFKNGRPRLALGAAGGPRIISTVLEELVDLLDLGWAPAEAVAQPRFHHQWFPDELVVEKAVTPELRQALEQRGHKVVVETSAMSISQIVARSPDDQSFVGVADPRVKGSAAGW
jgi:gamma-glutamyltranspeptidase/glutathione hydrolase